LPPTADVSGTELIDWFLFGVTGVEPGAGISKDPYSTAAGAGAAKAPAGAWAVRARSRWRARRLPASSRLTPQPQEARSTVRNPA